MPLSLSDLEILTVSSDFPNLCNFDCDDPDLNDFLCVDCHQYQRSFISHTKIALHQGRIVGFVTLCADAIELKTGEKRKIATFHGQVMQWPAIKIARLGVQKDLQRGGIGTALLQYAFAVANRVNQEIRVGCRFLTVDAYIRSVDWYLQKGFVPNKAYATDHQGKPKKQPSLRFDVMNAEMIKKLK